jgi:hypothetical protein
VDPAELSVAPDPPEKRVNPVEMDNLDPQVSTAPWANAALPVCLVSRELKDTEDCQERMVPRELKDNKASLETWENPVRSVLPAQWVPVVPVVSVVALDPQDLRVSVVVTDFQALEVPQDLLDPQDLRVFQANRAPREIKDNKDPKEAVASKVHEEKMVCQAPLVSRVFKEPLVWMVPMERKVPEETWVCKELQDSLDPEAHPVPLVIPEWLDPRVSRVNLVFLDSAV